MRSERIEGGRGGQDKTSPIVIAAGGALAGAGMGGGLPGAIIGAIIGWVAGAAAQKEGKESNRRD